MVYAGYPKSKLLGIVGAKHLADLLCSLCQLTGSINVLVTLITTDVVNVVMRRLSLTGRQSSTQLGGKRDHFSFGVSLSAQN